MLSYGQHPLSYCTVMQIKHEKTVHHHGTVNLTDIRFFSSALAKQR
jgi:hypothetical protein